MQHYFQLQRTIIERFLREWRLSPWLVCLVLPLLFVLGSLLVLERTDYAALGIVAISWSGFAWLSGQARNYFLRITYPMGTYRKIRLVENATVVLPVALLFLGKGVQALLTTEGNGLGVWYWMALTLVQCLVGLAMSYRTLGQRSSITFPTPFSKQPFEFAIGVRRFWWLLLFAAFLLVMGVRANNFELGAFAWFVAVFGAMSFYQKPEPGFYVWVHAMSGKALLNRKLRLGCQHLFLLSLPFLITLLIAFPAYWLFLAGGLLLAMAYLVLFIVAKYAAYPNEIDVLNAFLVGFGIMMPPVLLFLIPYYYRRAIARLGLIVP